MHKLFLKLQFMNFFTIIVVSVQVKLQLRYINIKVKESVIHNYVFSL